MKEQCPLTDVDGREQVEIEWFYFSSSCYLANHLLTVESELISISYQLEVKLHNSVSAEPHKLAPSSLSCLIIPTNNMRCIERNPCL